jgi:hypothetical protein
MTLARTHDLLLATYAEFYRLELAAEEDVHRTLPFFGTAIGVVIAAIGYGAARLPDWRDAASRPVLVAAIVLLVLAVVSAAMVVLWLGRAVARRDYQRIGPEPALRARADDFAAGATAAGLEAGARDGATVEQMRLLLLATYEAVTPANRALNQQRFHARAQAAVHLMRSLFLALFATTLIFVSDKIGLLTGPHVIGH